MYAMYPGIRCGMQWLSDAGLHYRALFFYRPLQWRHWGNRNNVLSVCLSSPRQPYGAKEDGNPGDLRFCHPVVVLPLVNMRPYYINLHEQVDSQDS